MERNGMITRRVIQIHVTRRCNLECLHCYSASGPHVSEELDSEVLLNLIQDAAALGYEVVSISGGEPFLFSGLSEVLEAAQSLGLRTTITTNGMPINERRLEQMAESIDLIAVSLDGKPVRHNIMRRSKDAFRILDKNLEKIKDFGIDFGFIHTATEESIQDLRWIVEYSIVKGGKLVQVHPLEMVGNARRHLSDKALNGEICTRIYLLCLILEKHFGDKIRFQVDVANRDILRYSNGIFFEGESCSSNMDISEFINPLVIDSDGTVLPFCYGIDRRYSIGNIRKNRLHEISNRFNENKFKKVFKLCSDLYHEEVSCIESVNFPYFNWYENLAAHSHSSSC